VPGSRRGDVEFVIAGDPHVLNRWRCCVIVAGCSIALIKKPNSASISSRDSVKNSEIIHQCVDRTGACYCMPIDAYLLIIFSMYASFMVNFLVVPRECMPIDDFLRAGETMISTIFGSTKLRSLLPIAR
jgi:hypothetical protein